MLLDVLPKTLYSQSNIKSLFVNKNSSILHKILNENLLKKEMYLSSVAILFIIKGKQIIANYNGEKVIVQQGQILFLPQDIYIVSDFVIDDVFEAMLFFMDNAFSNI